MPLSIDPAVLENGAVVAIDALAAVVALPTGVGPALVAVLPPLIGWIVTELEGGRDPKPAILALALATADTAADVAQAAKFGA